MTIKEINLVKYVEDRLCLEDTYGLDNTLENLVQVFKSEKSWEIQKYGERKAFISYCQGIPSSVDLPYWDKDIEGMLYLLNIDVIEGKQMQQFYGVIYDSVIKKN